jgi:hypothetical protein
VAIERMPQVLFVGDPSFWDIADQAAQAGFTELIGARFELAAPSREEAGVAVPRLASSHGGLPDAGTPGPDMAAAAHPANALVPMVLPPSRNRRIVQVAGLAAAAVGSLGVAAYWLGPVDFDRFWAAGRSGWQSSAAAPDQAPAATTVPPLPAATPAPLAQLDGPAPGAAVRPQPAPPLVAPALQWPAPRPPVHRRAAFSGYVTRSTPGTWLFPPGTGGGGG